MATVRSYKIFTYEGEKYRAYFKDGVFSGVCQKRGRVSGWRPLALRDAGMIWIAHLLEDKRIEEVAPPREFTKKESKSDE